MITDKDYDDVFYLRRGGHPKFDINGPITATGAAKAEHFADLIKGKRVLDVGCGRGEQARWFSEHGAAEVVGIDWSELALRIATHFCRKRKNVSNFQVDAREYLHKKKHYFDVVLMIDFIEHLTKADAQKVYARAWRHWVTPDGWLGVISPPRNKSVLHLYHQSEASLKRDIKNAGFRVVRLEKCRIGAQVFVVRAQRLRGGK